MAITSVGYDGTVSEVQWAKMIPSVGSSTYGVVGVTDWKVSVHPTLDKGINIAAGTGYGHGVYDVSDSISTVTGASLASGTRYDLVVARRDWTGAGGVTTFRIVTGTASRTMPTRANTPGSIDEQPIALVRFDAGQTKAAEIIDLRCWSGPGGASALDEMALGYLAEPGARVVINGDDWFCGTTANGTAWVKNYTYGRIALYGVAQDTLAGPRPPSGQMFQVQAGTYVSTTDHDGYARCWFPKPFPNGLVSLTLTNGDQWANGSADFCLAGREATFGSAGFGNQSQFVYAMTRADAGLASGRLPNARHRVNYIAIGW